MAAKKKKKAKVSIRYVRMRRRWATPEERKWHLWMHDVDTLLHEMVKNQTYQAYPADDLVARAEAFADAYHAMQDRRRPPGLEDDR
jgi:hypothetical protein